MLHRLLGLALMIISLVATIHLEEKYRSWDPASFMLGALFTAGTIKVLYGDVNKVNKG